MASQDKILELLYIIRSNTFQTRTEIHELCVKMDQRMDKLDNQLKELARKETQGPVMDTQSWPQHYSTTPMLYSNGAYVPFQSNPVSNSGFYEGQQGPNSKLDKPTEEESLELQIQQVLNESFENSKDD